MIGTILAAIDLAHPENHAMILTEARRRAEQDDGHLAVVTAIPDFGMSIVGAYFEEGAEQKALADAAEALHRSVAAVLGEAAEAGIKHVVRHGVAYEEILATAASLDARLIVMGAHRPNFQDYLLGPNAARVVRHSTCSVLVLRH
ncbi:universal stress protein [uncultured Jannaschia sp.]|uniref:universal stress protein n=1 Tax=uncultured Jannaschia sp. TaxID=293347 RepID=UPI002610DF00|nr:universal stress protein [uncultured Jannaschia sp.]